MLPEAIATLDVAQARTDVERFLLNPVSIVVWSKEFLRPWPQGQDLKLS